MERRDEVERWRAHAKRDRLMNGGATEAVKLEPLIDSATVLPPHCSRSLQTPDTLCRSREPLTILPLGVSSYYCELGDSTATSGSLFRKESWGLKCMNDHSFSPPGTESP